MHWKFGLDFLRAMAIIFVLLYHYISPEDDSWSKSYVFIQSSLHAGVDLFFTLSGFLISSHWFLEIQEKKFSFKSMLKNFYIKRLFRISPLYYLILLFEILRANFLTNTNYNLLSYLTLTQNLFTKTIFPVSWSLCVEEHFYLIFPISSYLLLSKKRNKIFLAAIILIFTLSPILRYFYYEQLSSSHTHELIQNTIFNLEGLAIGVFLGYLITHYKALWDKAEHYIRQIEITGFLILVLAFYIGSDKFPMTRLVLQKLLFSCSFGLFILSANFKKSIFNLFQNSFFTLTAKIAYPLYLTHYISWMILGLIIKYSGIQLSGTLLFVISILSSYFLAYTLHVLVENKFLTLRKKFLVNSNG